MFKRTCLKNGLQIVTNRLSGRESLALAIWVRVGARHESKEFSGISHFVEHMLFKGTKVRSTRAIKEEIEGVGGSMNAFTGEESTCYFVKIPKRYLRESFDVLQDMVNHSVFEPKECEKERAVILEEIKMYLDQPAQHVQEIISELLWLNQPLGRSIAGTTESVSRIQRADLLRHVAEYYHPQNLLIAACGDIEHEQIVSLATHSFGRGVKNQKSNFAPALHGKSELKSRTRLIEKKTEQTHFVMGYHGFHRAHPARYQLAVLNIILGGNMSSRLFEEVREQRGLAYEIRSGVGFFEDAGAVTISAGVEPAKVSLTLEVVLKELEKLRKALIPKLELERAKDYLIGQMVLGLEDTLDNALWFGEKILYGGNAPQVKRVSRYIEKVTALELRELANALFQKEKVHLALIGPLAKSDKQKIYETIS